MKTRPLDFRLEFDVPSDDLTLTLNVTHNGSSVTYQMPGESAVALTSGTDATINLTEAEQGFLDVIANSLDFTSVATAIQCDGELGFRIDQVPESCTSFETTATEVVMDGTWLPSGLTTVKAESLRSSVDVDRIITALEGNAQSSGTLFLAETMGTARPDLLESRSWTVDVPRLVSKWGKSSSPHTYRQITQATGGDQRYKHYHAVDKKRQGDRRSLINNYCMSAGGSYANIENLPDALRFQKDDSFTVMFWVRKTHPSQLHDPGAFLSTRGNTTATENGWEIIHNSGQDIGLNMNGTLATRSCNIATSYHLDALGTWNHICFTHDGATGTMKGYFNGVEDSTATTNDSADLGEVGAWDGELRFFNRPDASYGISNCEMTDIQIFGEVIPDAEILATANLRVGDEPIEYTYKQLLWLPQFNNWDGGYAIIPNIGTLRDAANVHNAGVSTVVCDRWSYADEVGYGLSLPRFDHGVADAWDVGFVSEYEFTGDGRIDIYWRDDAHGEDHVGFTDQSDSTYTTTTYQHARRCGVRLTATNCIPYLQAVSGTTTTTSDGDRFTIEIEGSTVYFKKNGKTFHSGSRPGGNLRFSYQNYSPHDTYTCHVSEGGTRLDQDDLNMYPIGSQLDRDAYANGGHAVCLADPFDKSKDILGLDLQFSGPAPWDPIILSPAPDFDGSSSIMISQDDVDIGGSEITMGIRCKIPATPASREYICGQWDYNAGNRSALISVDSSGKLEFYVSHDGTDSNYKFVTTYSDEYADDDWHDVVAVFDTVPKIYVDGVEVGGSVGGAGTVTAVASLTEKVAVGGMSGLANYFDGSACDFRISGTAATASQIFNNSWTPELLHWPMLENYGWTCLDVSGNGYHGQGTPLTRSAEIDQTEYFVANGHARGIYLNSSNSEWISYTGAPQLTYGGGTKMSGMCSFIADGVTSTTQCLHGQWDSSGNNKSWLLYLNGTNTLAFNYSDDGSTSRAPTSPTEVVTNTKPYNVYWTFDAGHLRIYLDGVLDFEDTSMGGTGVFHDGGGFAVGCLNPNHTPSGFFDGAVFRHGVEPGVVWTDEEIVALHAAQSTEEIRDIRPNMFYFPDAKTEVFRGKGTMTAETGTIQDVVVPANGGIAAAYPAGTVPPGVSRVLSHSQSSYAQTYASTYEVEGAAKCYQADFPGAADIDLGSILIGTTADFDISLDFMPTDDPAYSTLALLSQYTAGTDGRMHITLSDVNTTPKVGFFAAHNAGTNVLIYSGDNTVELNKWHNVRATRSGDDFELFLDGVSVGTQTESGVSIQARNTHIGTDWSTSDFNDYVGKIRNVRIDYNGTVTKYLTENIALPGATLTAATLEESDGGVYGGAGGRSIFVNADGTIDVYAAELRAELADVIATKKNAQSFS